jgi:hypothetical protein
LSTTSTLAARCTGIASPPTPTPTTRPTGNANEQLSNQQTPETNEINELEAQELSEVSGGASFTGAVSNLRRFQINPRDLSSRPLLDGFSAPQVRPLPFPDRIGPLSDEVGVGVGKVGPGIGVIGGVKF